MDYDNMDTTNHEWTEEDQATWDVEYKKLETEYSYLTEQQKNYADLNDKLGGPGASAKAAEIMITAIGT